ncbi:G1 family glutamic endopeptidase [Streptomyces sp. NPDC058476]|uniref:G1 family glutamic endopeptidase n=1 Tax=Streptomyces sp. NPDC058476 TaxID=3346519 RepID=UPI003656F08F
MLRDAHDGDLHLPMYSNSEGFLDFYIRPSGEAKESARLTIDANANGELAQHLIEIRSGDEPDEHMPLPPAKARWQPRRNARIRPGLELDECLTFDNEELLRRDYPPRPDPELVPAAFDAWRRAVSAPAAAVEPHVTPHPYADHTYATMNSVGLGEEESDNWSGFALASGAGTYDWVGGQWNVPGVAGIELNRRLTICSSWIGLDGNPGEDLVQAGTDTECTAGHFPGSHVPFAARTYRTWIVFIPIHTGEQVFTDFQTRPGDLIQCQVYIANEGGMPSLSGSAAVFYISNLTTGEYINFPVPRGSVSVRGGQAEWIMERPKINHIPTDLCNYGIARMTTPVAQRVDGAHVGYFGDDTRRISMVTDPQRLLSSVSALDTAAMEFTWHAFH